MRLKIKKKKDTSIHERNISKRAYKNKINYTTRKI